MSKDSLIDESRKSDISPYNLSKFDGSLALDYMLNSKLDEVNIKKLAPITKRFYSPFVQERASLPFKRYEDKEQINFDEYVKSPNEVSFFDVITNRKSRKSYNGLKITLNELFRILHYSYGISRVEKLRNNIPWRYRMIPSPGGLFSSEIYLILVNSHLPKGLYHYRPDINALEVLKKGDFSSFMKNSLGLEPYIDSIDTIGGILVTTSLIERVYTKYGERGYRFMMLEVGFLAQNLSLVIESLGLGSCMLGGYFDDAVNNFIGIDGILETVQNVMVFGGYDIVNTIN